MSGMDKTPRMPVLSVMFSASGAAEAGRSGHVVVIVDIVHMSTTAEACLSAGATAVFGASPLGVTPPVALDPISIARKAAAAGSGEVVVFSEPRGPNDDEARRASARHVIEAVEQAGGRVVGVYPNLGIDSPEYCDLAGKTALIVSHAGGVCYDAASTAGAAHVTTATVVRGWGRKGWEAAAHGVERAIAEANSRGAGISFVAASANAPEDVLGAFELSRLAITLGFLDYKL